MLAFRRFVKRNVVVNTKTDKAFRGVLWKKTGPILVLKQATVHHAGSQAEIDGDVLVERSNIDFIQVLPGS